MARTPIAGQIPGSVNPTQRTQFARQTVAQPQSSRAGLEGLGSTFARFFDQAQDALSDVQGIVHRQQLQEVQRENEVQAQQAQADFYSGNGPDPSLANDLDYVKTYKALKSNRLAADAERDFNEWYRTEWLADNPFGDLSAARQAWAQQNLGGLDDPEMQSQVLGRFFKNTESMIGQHQEFGFREKVRQDTLELQTSLNDDVRSGDITPEKVEWYMNAAREIDPLNPGEAAPRVVSTLLASVQNNPAATQRVLDTLSAPGTGIDGRSFADSFPAAYADFQVKALRSYTQENTLAEREYFGSIEEEMRLNPNPSQEDLSDWAYRLTVGKSVYGSGNKADALRNQLIGSINNRAETQANLGRVDAMLRGEIGMDASHMRKHFMDYATAKYGVDSILQAPAEQIAHDISRMQGVIPENVKVQLSGALLNATNPDAQHRALEIIQGITGGRGTEYVDDYLTDEGARMFRHLEPHLQTGMSLPDVVSRTNAARQNKRDPSKVDWRSVMGTDSVTEAKTQVGDKIYDHVQSHFERNGLLTGAFRTDVQIPDSVMDQISEYAKVIVAERGPDGVTADDAIAEATQRFLNQAEVVGPVDQPILRLGSTLEQVSADGEGLKPKVKLGFNVQAPNGQRVNTRQIFEDEMREVQESAGFLFSNGNSDGVSLAEAPELPGTYALREADGSGVLLEVNETFTWDGVNYTVPDNQEELEAMFGEIMPDGFVFRKVQGAAGEGWQVYYEPHFGDEVKSYADLEAGHASVKSKEDYLAEIQTDLINSSKDSGLLSEAAGMNTPAPPPEDASQILSYLEAKLREGQIRQGRTFIDRRTVETDGTYRSRRMNFLTSGRVRHERVASARTGKRVVPGEMSHDQRVVGYGFNLDASDARETFSKVLGDDADFDQVYQGAQSLTPAQSERLLEFETARLEKTIAEAADGRALPESEHLALMSVFHSSEKLRNDPILRQNIAKGDHVNVLHTMLYQGYDSKDRATKAARYRAAVKYVGNDPLKRPLLPDPKGFVDNQAYEFAQALRGLEEVPDNASLKSFLRDGGVNLDPAKTAWCAAFVNAALQHAGIDGTGSNLARSFLDWGESVKTPQRGDIVVFSRTNNPLYGHVGFFDGFNANGTIRVLGGNQGRNGAVSVANYSRERLLGFRRAPVLHP